MGETSPQTRRSRWTCSDSEVLSTIVLVSRMVHRFPGIRQYRRLYTVEVEYGDKRLRVRSVPLDEALAWEKLLVHHAFAELGAVDAPRGQTT